MKKEPMELIDTKFYRDRCAIEVYQNSKVTHAVLSYMNGQGVTIAQFHGSAVRSDDDEFDTHTGMDIAVARAKKAYHEYYGKFLKKTLLEVLEDLNQNCDDIEFLTKKYGLNRKARDEKDDFKMPRFKIIKEWTISLT